VHAIERRQRKVYVPRTMGAIQALRTLTLSRLGGRLTSRITGGGAFVEQLIAEEAGATARPISQDHAG
jgi:hypothetical protein